MTTNEVGRSHHPQGERIQNPDFATEVLHLEAIQARDGQGCWPCYLVMDIVPCKDLGQNSVGVKSWPRQVKQVVVASPTALRQLRRKGQHPRVSELGQGIPQAQAVGLPQVPGTVQIWEGLEAYGVDSVAAVQAFEGVPAQLSLGAESANLTGIEALGKGAGCQDGIEVHVEDACGSGSIPLQLFSDLRHAEVRVPWLLAKMLLRSQLASRVGPGKQPADFPEEGPVGEDQGPPQLADLSRLAAVDEESHRPQFGKVRLAESPSTTNPKLCQAGTVGAAFHT
eukprot:CAMPEP_0181467252 /NCGR_PEP_ID=MMETSP1110-20121109/36883_1 /TAXON_ID=174948 /ORGANISM="Symbiodinium sp., Strain CCMP421" /LENGTH=281 /DNA_ID=CAMNT_0023592073 /DNA_START=1151 /DNA_END=1993 /DNA_ORIENTATION=-